MRASEFISKEQKLDEVLPLITGAAALAGSVARGAGAAVSGIGKGVGALAKGVGTGAGNLASKIGKPMGQEPTDPNQKVDPAQEKNIDRAKDQLLRPGRKIVLPTDGPTGPQAFKVTKVQGDEVEIENPEGNKSPNQPNKIIYNRDDIKKTINI